METSIARDVFRALPLSYTRINGAGSRIRTDDLVFDRCNPLAGILQKLVGGLGRYSQTKGPMTHVHLTLSLDKWSRWGITISRPSHPKCDALPLSYT